MYPFNKKEDRLNFSRGKTQHIRANTGSPQAAQSLQLLLIYSAQMRTMKIKTFTLLNLNLDTDITTEYLEEHFDLIVENRFLTVWR